MNNPEFFKPSWAVLDYYVDYDAEFTRLGILIATSFWVLPCALTDDSINTSLRLADAITPDYDAATPAFRLGGTANDGYRAQIIISGGTAGTSYLIQNYAIPTGNVNRRYSRQFTLTVTN